MQIETIKSFNTRELDALVEHTYGRPYCFQQQDGCQPRGTLRVTVPSDCAEDYEDTTIPEIINGPEMGVSFAAWLARDPSEPVGDRSDDFAIELFWERNFYPSLEVVLNDLHARGLIDAGDYLLVIDW